MPECGECGYDFGEDPVGLAERCVAFGARLTAFDWDLAASEGRYRERAVTTVAGDLRRACAELAELARSVTRDDLARAGTGSDGTPRTVGALLARAGHELAHHELDIRRGVQAATTTPRPR